MRKVFFLYIIKEGYCHEDLLPRHMSWRDGQNTTAADSRTKIVITLDTQCRSNPLFDNQTVLERRNGPILVLLSAAVVRIGVNCARLLARLLLFHWNNIYIDRPGAVRVSVFFEMVFSFFPNLVPRNASPSWFQADKPSNYLNYLCCCQ
jgi:hypothetical protein